MKHIPWAFTIIESLPLPTIKRLAPEMASFIEQKMISADQVKKIIAGENQDWRGKQHPTIFHAALDSKLPPHEKSIERLADDAQMLVMAGTVTTAAALDIITYHLLTQPSTLRKLKNELLAILPSVDDVGKVPLSKIEALPYLTGVIKEGCRLSYGVSTRLQRVDPEHPIVFRDKKADREWVIPAGTPVGMTSVQLHHDEENFPESRRFMPERWLGSEGRRLDRYLVTFSKGTRSCLGINLAYGEMYLVLAGLWYVDPPSYFD